MKVLKNYLLNSSYQLLIVIIAMVLLRSLKNQILELNSSLLLSRDTLNSLISVDTEKPKSVPFLRLFSFY
ncbi:hypothetical protein EFM07_12530 [Lactococcus lactis]|nr:hypothetical protein [Lactococcus lactis]